MSENKALERGKMRLSAQLLTRVSNRDEAIDLAALNAGSCFATDTELDNRSVLVMTASQLASASAMVELDGRASRITIVPPDLRPQHVISVIDDAKVEAIVSDRPASHVCYGLPVHGIGAPQQTGIPRSPPRCDTEWVLLTSGTLGPPKMVAHSLGTLTDAIETSQHKPTWATFYDIRRFGGLQILLRALLGGTDLVLTSEHESLGDHLQRLSAAGVTAMSGTPSHWRRVLMSGKRGAFVPHYIRLSGETADQLVLDGLRSAFPHAKIDHAYASTEAGVGFTVDDGLEGFPVSFVEKPKDNLEMKVISGSLHIKSRRTAARYLGAAAPPLVAADGFIDTGDLVQRRGERFHFVGRRGGIINVGGLKVNPEEVEAALNCHAAVRMSLVQARRNPLTGAVVVAQIVLQKPTDGTKALEQEILESCRIRLDRHKVPAMIRFVTHLTLTAGGKLNRAND